MPQHPIIVCVVIVIVIVLHKNAPVERTDEVAVGDGRVQSIHVVSSVVQRRRRPVRVLERDRVDAKRRVELLTILRIVIEQVVQRDLVPVTSMIGTI